VDRRFEQFEHGADVGVRGFGATPAEAFEGAAAALFTLLCADLSRVRPARAERIEAESGTLDELLVAFLNELISLSDARRLVFGRVSVSIEEAGGRFRLDAVAEGEPFDPERHEFTVVPKGASFTALRVATEDGVWLAQCVVDV
jgi:SHS2 domain-containing protein